MKTNKGIFIHTKLDRDGDRQTSREAERKTMTHRDQKTDTHVKTFKGSFKKENNRDKSQNEKINKKTKTERKVCSATRR